MPLLPDTSMKIKKTVVPSVRHVTGGLDARVFDLRPFPFSGKVIERLCGAYHIGRLERFVPERNIRVSHSNFIVYVKTARGEFLLKFYTRERPESFLRELSIDRFLVARRFPVSAMLTAGRQKPFVRLPGAYAACYDWIDARPLYDFSLNDNLLSGVADIMVGMRSLLRDFSRRHPGSCGMSEPFDQRLAALCAALGRFGAWKQAAVPFRALDRLEGFYRRHRSLFTPALLHANLGLSNILMKRGRFFVVDLAHVKSDLGQQDLASMSFSLYLFDMPLGRIKAFARMFLGMERDPGGQEALWHALFLRLAVQKLEKTLDKETKALSLHKDSALVRSYLQHIHQRKTQLLSVIDVLGRELPSA
jgi:Ser/Thr protein kinase RdoA (MazF antagonist)